MSAQETFYALQLRSSSRCNEERAGPNIFFSVPVPGTRNTYNNILFQSVDDAKSRIPEFMDFIRMKYGDFETNDDITDDEMTHKGIQRIIELEFEDFNAHISVIEFNLSQTLIKPAST